LAHVVVLVVIVASIGVGFKRIGEDGIDMVDGG
jgi:hypothetical protein